MQVYNVLLGCDQIYYDKWAVPLLLSIHHYNPWVQLHCHIVNPTKINKIDYVDITTEQREFSTEDAKISYLQSVRFLVASEKFNNHENVFTLDADSICTRKFNQQEIKDLFQKQHVLMHPKDNRWLAGLVVFNQNGFRQALYKELTTVPFDNWEWGRDQTVLNTFKKEFNFEPLDRLWMSIGKIKRVPSAFLTLKGDQKFTAKYLQGYEKYKS